MLPVLLLLALVTSAPQAPPQQGEDPRALVWSVVRAVEADSAARLRSRFAARLKRNPNDRAAQLALATLSRLQYDYQAAETAYRKLIAGARDRITVYAHLGLAEGYDERSVKDAVRGELDLARDRARALGDRVAEAEALVWLAFTRGRIEGVHVAEAVLDTAARLIPDTALVLRARLHSRNAIVHALRARPAPASAAADSAIRLAQRARAPRVEADAYRMLGQVLQYRGQWDSAFAALRQSQRLYELARSRGALAASLIWHAQVLGSQARYGEMRDVMQRALTEGIATNNPGAIGDAQRAFGVLSVMFGDWPAAARYFEQSVATSASSGDSSSVTLTRKYQARVAMVAGDVATAKRITLNHLAIGQRTNNAMMQYEANRTLADLAEREGDTAAVTRLLAAARAQLPQIPGPAYRVWLLHDEARHAIARGDLVAATRLLESFLAGSAGAIGALVRFDARVRLADVFARRGDVARAERELASATDEIESYRAGLDDAQLRTLAFQVVATVDAAAADPDAIAASAARVIAALAQAGRVDGAFLLAERWRARELMDRLTRAGALRSTQPAAAAGPLSRIATRTATELRAALPDERTAILEYVAAEDAPVTLFVLQRGRMDARVLAPLDSIKPAVARLNALIAAGANPAALARSLGAALIDPALAVLDRSIARLVIVPDGPLHRLPFDALSLADGNYLLQRFASSVAPSAAVAVALWTRAPAAARTTAPPPLLAFGDPAPASAPGGATRDANGTMATLPDRLPRLAGAAREARLVARYSPSAQVRLGRAATAAFLKRTDLRRFQVLHFATHAIVDEHSLAGTALALAPGDGESGYVSAGDLAALRLNASLVVLSACSSAGGMLARGEGVQGLTSSLLQAGARSLVATAWRIPDQDVVPLIDDFYAALARGLPVGDALRATKLAALRKGAPARTWAAFIVVGDPLVSVPLREPPRHWWSSLFSRR